MKKIGKYQIIFQFILSMGLIKWTYLLTEKENYLIVSNFRFLAIGFHRMSGQFLNIK